MGAPKGNQNAMGNKGGGRSRAVDIEKLWALWNNEIDLDSLDIKYNPDKGMIGPPFDIFAYEVLSGDRRARKLLMNKSFLDLL